MKQKIMSREAGSAFGGKKTALILIAVILISVIGGGIYIYQQTQPKQLGEITYGWNAWPGNLPYIIAYEQGFFKEQGLDVKFVKETGYGAMLNNFISGQTDFSGIALIDVAEKVSKGNNLKVILAHDYSNGADGIVAKKEIKSISELKAKKVAIEIGTLGEYLLYDALKKYKLTLADITEINLSAQDAAQAFIRGEVDAAVTYEPDFSQAVNQGSGWRLYTSTDSPGLIIDVLAFKSDFVAQNPLKVAAVTRAYFKAMDFISANPEAAYEIGAKYFEITPSEFKDQLSGLKLLNLDDNLNLMAYGNGSDSLHGLIHQAYNFLKEKGIVLTPVDSTEIVEPKFIRELIK